MFICFVFGRDFREQEADERLHFFGSDFDNSSVGGYFHHSNPEGHDSHHGNAKGYRFFGGIQRRICEFRHFAIKCTEEDSDKYHTCP